jgi:hypothetical protein
MNLKNTEHLLTTYPLLYRKLREFGFECQDGWFELVWQLSADIESTARLEGVQEQPATWPSIRILKQKFGTLRVSFDFDVEVSEAIRALSDKAYELSMETCELCGSPAHIYSDRDHGRWVESRCEKCRKAYPESSSQQNEAPKIPVWLQIKNNQPK